MLAIAFVAAATIGGEMHAPFKDWLAATFTHHWVGKGIIASVILFLGGAVLAPTIPARRSVTGLLWVLFVVTIVAFLAIVGFYVDHALGVH